MRLPSVSCVPLGRTGRQDLLHCHIVLHESSNGIVEVISQLDIRVRYLSS